MTALSVVTVAFSTEGCVDEHMEQGGEVCIHPPLQLRLIVAIARCFVILAKVRRSHSDCSADVGLGALLTAMLEKMGFLHEVHCVDAWFGQHLTCCATQILLHSRGQFFKGDEQDHCSACRVRRAAPWRSVLEYPFQCFISQLPRAG